MGKGHLLALFKIKQQGQNILRTPQRALAAETHISGSRAACLVLSLSRGLVPSLHSCAICDGSLNSLPQQCGQWTMSSFQRLAKKEKGACQTWPRANLSAISCLWATPEEKVLGLARHGQDLASLPSGSKQTSLYENPERNPMEKETLWPSGMLWKLAHRS